jgi:hypothetical protein
VHSTLFTGYKVAVATLKNALTVPCIADLTSVSFATITLQSLQATRVVALMICLRFPNGLHHTTATLRAGYRTICLSISPDN